LLLVIFSLFFAVLITNIKRFQKFFQMLFYSPAVLSSVVAAVIWLFIFDPRGLANQGLNFIASTRGVDYKWLASTNMLRLATVVVYFWKYVGYFTIIFIAGIGSIPSSLYEASKIDGATPLQEFFYITLPLLKPTTLLVSIMAMVRCLKTFSTQYLFTTAGAPSRPINVMTLNIYNTAIQDHRIGLASAMSILLFLVLIFFAWFQLKVSKSDEVSYQ
jgi:multiple sugar transport system permease protein